MQKKPAASEHVYRMRRALLCALCGGRNCSVEPYINKARRWRILSVVMGFPICALLNPVYSESVFRFFIPKKPSTAAPAKAIAPIIRPAHGVVEIPEMTVATGFLVSGAGGRGSLDLYAGLLRGFFLRGLGLGWGGGSAGVGGGGGVLGLPEGSVW